MNLSALLPFLRILFLYFLRVEVGARGRKVRLRVLHGGTSLNTEEEVTNKEMKRKEKSKKNRSEHMQHGW